MRITGILGFVFVYMLVFTSTAQTLPGVSIIPLTKNNCINTSISFGSLLASDNTPLTPQTDIPINYEWTVLPNKGLTQLPVTNTSSISLNFSIATTFTLTLKISRSELSRTVYTVVTIGNIPKASFNASFSGVGYPNELVLTSYSTNSLVNHWIYSDTNKIDSTANTIKTYTSGGTYSVMLVTIGSQGCRDTSSYQFYLADSSDISLPNIFTPNNDEVNDIFKPITKGISYLKASIYNRSSVLIHTWEGAEGFWDGYTNSGEPCTDGEYFIVVKAIGFDGKLYNLHGHITLVR